MKRLISLILMLAMVISIIPNSAFAAPGGRVILEVCADEAYIRKSASQDAKTLHTARKDAILTCTGSTVNKHGNVWFSVECIDASSGNLTTGWVYSERVREHTHYFNNAGDGLTFCRCGMVSHSSSGNVQMADAAVLGPGDMIGLGVAAELAKVKGAIGAFLGASVPYLAIGAVGSILVYIAFTTDIASYEVRDVATDWRKLDSKFRPDEGVYYEAVAKNGFMTIAFNNPMDQYEAELFMERAINIWNANKYANWCVYTLTDLSAFYLAGDFIETRPQYTVTLVEGCHEKGNLMKQFMHYHIKNSFNPSQLGSHILYGSPMCNSYREGAWA